MPRRFDDTAKRTRLQAAAVGMRRRDERVSEVHFVLHYRIIPYGAILVGANAAKNYFGSAGLYVSSFASGLADVDAITLSVATLSQDGNVAIPTAARAIVLAAIANTLVKGGIVLMMGSRAL